MSTDRADPHEVHRLRHSLGQITVDAVDARLAHEREIAAVAPGDMIQQVQLTIAGEATATSGADEFEVYWADPFLHDVARGDMDYDLDNPSFASGIELLADAAVWVQVQVRRWLRDDSSLIVGALVRVLVMCPEATQTPAPFRGTLHLSFIGYGVPSDDDDQDEEADD